MKERAVFRIDITQQAAKRLIDFSQKSGVTQIAIASNLPTWFATHSRRPFRRRSSIRILTERGSF